MPAHPAPGRWHHGLRPYVAGMLALGATAVLVCLPLALGDPPELWRLLAVLVLCAAADLPLVQRRVGHSTEAFTFSEACVLAALVLVPGPALVVVVPVAVALFSAGCRIPVYKASFNALSAAVGTALSCLVLLALGQGPSDGDLTVREVLGLVAATLVFHVWNSVAISGAMARAQGVGFRSMYRQGALMRTVVCGGNLAVGVVVVVVGHWNVLALVLLPPVLIALYLLYGAYLRAKEERDVWQQLEAATRELNLLEEGPIAAAALRRAQQLFRTDSVELLLLQPAGGSRLYRLDEHGDVVAADLPDEQVQDAPDAVVQDAAEDGPALHGLVAALDGPRGRVGVLRLVFGGPVSFSARERQVLSTFAHAVSTTLLNAALHAGVRAEADRQAHEASHDHLTGLGNRSKLSSATSRAVEQGDGTTALLLLDLDHFKEINDTLGHAAGDVLLQAIATRLAGIATDARLVARLGGDEFAVLLTGLSTPVEAEPVADAVLRLLAEPVDFEGLLLSVEGSLGIACHPQDADTSVELFRRADVAMYQAKSSRASWLRYSADRDDSSVHRQALVAELRSAIDAGELVVHYQPQVDLETGLVVGAEALCRWQHPTRGLLQPGAFIQAAEHSGLVRPFTLRVLDEAIAECAGWQQGPRPVSLAVNLSARSLLDRQLPDDVARLLDRHGLAPDRLVLEITETTATSELEVVEDVLARLRRLGVEISVDDFGTGYSSLAFLQRTAVNELKVDRSFVAGMLRNDNDHALVRATVNLAHSLGARAVAEGVEDPALAEALRQMGCDVGQGYWFSRPVPAHEVRALLHTRVGRDGVPTLVPAPRGHLKAVLAQGA